ncbi:MAG: GerMN domain-containing protein [Acetobacteraceae bacterium]|nr:GerMN domain-containing protein [Acetobacteraceae bacterium]
MRRSFLLRLCVVVLALSLAAATGCARKGTGGEAGAPGAKPPAAAPSAPAPSASTGGGGSAPPAQPAAPPQATATPGPLPDAAVTPLSPGVASGGKVTVREAMVRALFRYQSTFQPASATLELNGRPLQAEVLRSRSGPGAQEGYLILGARLSGLGDGPYRARALVGGADGRKTGAEWTFTVEAGAAPPAQTGTALTLYFADEPLVVAGADGEFGLVVPVRRVVPSTAAPARAAIEQLIAGPLPGDGEVGRTLPATARLRGLTIRDGVARVDFSAEFARDHAGGTTGGAVTVQSIVYTLTEFPTVKAVQVLVEGQPWSDGHFVWDKPWPRPTLGVEKVSLPPCK